MSSSVDRSIMRRRVLPAALLAVILPGALAGCAKRQQQTQTPPPLVIDGAMQRREWDRSVAYYPNGDTVSGYNRFPIRTDAMEGENEYGAAFFDIAASLVQTAALPFTYIFIPPFSKAVYHGDDIRPTYTAMPDMRPPVTTVRVDGLEVDRDTLEVVGRPQKARDERYRRYGPQGPGDTEFMSNDPAPAEEFD